MVTSTRATIIRNGMRDATQPERIAQAAEGRARLIFIEMPSNPQLKITGIREAARIAAAAYRRR
jgi:cystathionine beta-lyase/cystathionine gamma-synthase